MAPRDTVVQGCKGSDLPNKSRLTMEYRVLVAAGNLHSLNIFAASRIALQKLKL